MLHHVGSVELPGIVQVAACASGLLLEEGVLRLNGSVGPVQSMSRRTLGLGVGDRTVGVLQLRDPEPCSGVIRVLILDRAAMPQMLLDADLIDGVALKQRILGRGRAVEGRRCGDLVGASSVVVLGR